MERSEPTLVPEWLKNAGSSSTGSSISHSVLDDHQASRAARNKFSVKSNGNDLGRSSSSERTTSYFRRSSSSNGSGNFRSYNSFGRNQRDRDLKKDTYDSCDQENTTFRGRHRNFSDPFGDTSLSKSERDGLRRSQSMISAKRGEAWPRRVAADSGTTSVRVSNGLLTKGSPTAGVGKATFERDFPSLGVDERAIDSEIRRVPSPGLCTAIQSLPTATSASLGGEKLTSALAEVPILVGTNGTASLSVLQATSASSSSVGMGSTTSLNMAEAVAQGPNRAQTTSQLSVGAHRLEELAIKQSKQLIPLTPSMPKTSVLNSSDKLKSKVVGQQHSISSSVPVNHSPRGGSVKGDVSKASNVGKLCILKPAREKNGISPAVKDNLSPTSGSSIAASSPVSTTAATKGPPNNAVPDRKHVLTLLEKRRTSQARSRNDFFNLVRKKSMTNSAFADSAATSTLSVSDTATAVSPPFSGKHVEMDAMPATDQPVERPLSLSLNVNCLSEEKAGPTCNGDAYDAQKCVSNCKKYPSSDPIISEEEEVAFLRSMGWEENDDEEGLTEEEINAFYQNLTKYINLNPSPRILQLVQNKFLTAFDSQLGDTYEISLGLNSSDDKLEA